MRPTEVIFEVTEAPDGGYDAKALSHSIFTQGEDWNDLKQMARDAVLCHFGEDKAPRVVRLHRTQLSPTQQSLVACPRTKFGERSSVDTLNKDTPNSRTSDSEKEHRRW